jgi:hypothetical protein
VLFARVRDLVDLVVLLVYFSLFSFGAFWYRMHSYGHHLSPEAPIKVAPFTPPLFGHQHLANFDIYSFPGIGSFLLLGAAACLVAVLVLDARRTMRA